MYVFNNVHNILLIRMAVSVAGRSMLVSEAVLSGVRITTYNYV